MSHYRLQQTLDTAPSMTQNSISKLLLTTDESNSGAKVYTGDSNDQERGQKPNQVDSEFEILTETIPYSYITECLHLLKQLESRLQSDIYRGVLLEVVQRISNDIQISLMQGETVTSQSLLLAHAHFAFLFKEFLSKDSILASPVGFLKRAQSSGEFGSTAVDLEVNESPSIERIVSLDEQEDNSSQDLDEQPNGSQTPTRTTLRQSSSNSFASANSVNEADNRGLGDAQAFQSSDQESDDEVDIEKTKEGLWTLLTGQYETVMKYESVFKFIEESMPQLKRVQQENMRIQVQKIIFQLK